MEVGGWERAVEWKGLAEGADDMDNEPWIGVSGLFQGMLKPQAP